MRHVAYPGRLLQAARSESGTATARRERDRTSAAQVPGLSHLFHSATPHNESGLTTRPGRSKSRHEAGTVSVSRLPSRATYSKTRLEAGAGESHCAALTSTNPAAFAAFRA